MHTRDYYKNILRLHLENCIAAPSGCQTEGNGRKLGVSAKYRNTEEIRYMKMNKNQVLNNLANDDRVLVTTEELCRILSVGRRNAEKIGTAAGAKFILSNIHRWDLEKIKRFVRLESF